MSTVGSFDKTQHLAELDEPLFVQKDQGATAGVLTPAERRAEMLLNLFGSETGDAIDLGASDSSLSNVDYIDLVFAMDTAAQTGGRAKFHTDITAALGSWSNALKADVAYGTGGSTSGLGSSMVAEVTFGPDSDDGNFGVYEGEINAPASSVNPALTNFMYFSMQGDTTELAALDDDIALFDVNGTTAGAGNMLLTFSQITDAAVQASLRVRVNGTTWYIPLMDTQDGS